MESHHWIKIDDVVFKKIYVKTANRLLESDDNPMKTLYNVESHHWIKIVKTFLSKHIVC